MEAAPARWRLLLIATALLFSTGGAAIKAASLTGWQVASFRSLVAVLFMTLAVPEARRGWSWRLAPAAGAYAATLILFVLANRLTTAANAIFLQSTAPLYLLVLAPWLLHEPVRRRDLLFAGVVAAGMVLCFLGTGHAVATAADPPRGNLLATASGLFWALTVTGLRWLGKSGSENRALATVAAGNAVAFVVALPMALPLNRLRGADAVVILYLGVVQIGLAYICLGRAIRHVPAFEATTVLLLEPVMNPIWTWLVHGERPGTATLAGGAVILLATLGNAWRQK
jgi:drug/metabolite transporter (DMT)-like permease